MPYNKSTGVAISLAWVLVCTLFHDGHAQQEQFIRLWRTDSPTCAEGDHIATHYGLTNYHSFVSGTTGYYYRPNGLWGLAPCGDTDCTDSAQQIVSGGGTGGGPCTLYSIAPGSTRLRTSRFGDADQVAVAISLFEEEGFQGAAVTVTATGLDFATPRSFKSYFFTGPNLWSIGGSTCLAHEISGTYGVTYSVSRDLPGVNSVKLGCDGVDPTQTPPTTTTTQPPTTTTSPPDTTTTAPPTTTTQGPTDGTTTTPSSTTTGNPVTTTTSGPGPIDCQNRPDGFFPHPTDCSKFVGCRGGNADVYQCQDGFLYNPAIGVCDDAAQVECEFDCSGRPDGTYAHPRDCGSYVICRSEVTSMIPCPPPLLFDKTLLVCNFPELVQC